MNAKKAKAIRRRAREVAGEDERQYRSKIMKKVPVLHRATSKVLGYIDHVQTTVPVGSFRDVYRKAKRGYKELTS